MKQQEFREKLALLTLFRIIVALVLLCTLLLFEFMRDLTFLTGEARGLLYVASIGLLALSAISSGLSRRKLGMTGLQALAYLQFMGDAAFSTTLVVLTGGVDSLFTFIYSLSIINSSIVLYRKGALLTATVNTACLAGVAVVQMGLLGVPARLAQFFASSSGDAVVLSVTAREVVPVLVVNVVAFYSVAFLSSFLAEQLRAADVRAQRQKQGLDELRVLHENIVSSLESGLMTVDLDGRVNYVNRSACELLGLQLGDVAGRSVFEFFPELHVAMDTPEKRRLAHAESTVQQLGGRRVFLNWTISPLFDRNRRQVGNVLLFMDATRFKEMEETVARSEHLAALGRLAANIAHEIRNPLASMSGSIQLLMSGLEVQGSDRKLMEIVVREADHLNRWIGEFLEFARPRNLQLEELDLHELVCEVVEMLRHDERTCGVELRGPQSRINPVRADKVRMRQVVWNLVLNAVEAACGAMAKGESKSLPSDHQPSGPEGAKQGFVSVELAQNEEATVLAVTDTGPGIPSSQQSRVFEPFYTTKTNGTGLGLATVHRNVEEHSGTIRIESGPDGCGASFVVTIPHLKGSGADVSDG